MGAYLCPIEKTIPRRVSSSIELPTPSTSGAAVMTRTPTEPSSPSPAMSQSSVTARFSAP